MFIICILTYNIHKELDLQKKLAGKWEIYSKEVISSIENKEMIVSTGTELIISNDNGIKTVVLQQNESKVRLATLMFTKEDFLRVITSDQVLYHVYFKHSVGNSYVLHGNFSVNEKMLTYYPGEDLITINLFNHTIKQWTFYRIIKIKSNTDWVTRSIFCIMFICPMTYYLSRKATNYYNMQLLNEYKAEAIKQCKQEEEEDDDFLFH